MMIRKAEITRKTKETEISLTLELNEKSIYTETGIGFFDHMLMAMFFYAGCSCDLKVTGDLHVDGHHTVEDTAIVIGKALGEALGDKKGIRRFAHAYIPMDEALCFTALDLSGRPFLVFDAPMPQARIGDYETCLTAEFFRALSVNAGITLHMKAMYGDNAHHITEALFKSFGVALRQACEISGKGILSTKGHLD
jgi:imidazoleglycerol-phosphate dehydratase